MTTIELVLIAATLACLFSASYCIGWCRAQKESNKETENPSKRPTKNNTSSFLVPPFLDCADQRALTQSTDWFKVAHYTAIGFFAVVMGPLFASGAAYVVATLWGRL